MRFHIRMRTILAFFKLENVENELLEVVSKAMTYISESWNRI